MGAGAVNGHSTSPRTNQVFPSHTSSVASSTCRGQPLNGSGDRNMSQSAARGHSSTGNIPYTVIESNMPKKVLACDTCENNFTFFKRKKLCKECHRWFCSTCLPKPPSSLRQNGRQCAKCTILTSGKFTRQQLMAWRIKDMRCFLDVRNIPTSTCKEKHDLIDLVLLHFCLESNSVLREQREHELLVGELADRMRNSSFYASPTLPHQVPHSEGSSPVRDFHPEVSESHDPASPGVQPTQDHSQETSGEEREGRPSHPTSSESNSTDTDTNNSHSFLSGRLQERQMREMREAMQRLQEELSQDEPETRQGIQRASIDDLKSEDEADGLTVRQLKEILVNNFVDYRGCCEKRELVDRVKRLWKENQANRQRVLDATEDSNPQDTAGPASTSGEKSIDPENDICKICMDAAIDCILLECGHMVTCTKCGKRLADCPICRQYIIRVVHVFRS